MCTFQFIYPLPRNDGYEFMMSQFDGNVIYFTPLAVYQSLKENAPPCLTVAHFTEFKDDKGNACSIVIRKSRKEINWI
jgi:ATP synthase F1 complex assembly factor 1